MREWEPGGRALLSAMRAPSGRLVRGGGFLLIDIVIRSVIGYLSQVVPCAALALIPFWDSLAIPKRAAAIRVTAFVIGLCAVFTAANALPADPVPESFAFVMELIFYATLVVFFWQYRRVVDASPARKVFVFLLATAYGCACLMTSYVLGMFLIEDHHGDGRMYLWSTLPATVAIGAIGFVPALLFTRRVLTPYLSLDLSEREWRARCLIPAAIVVCLVGGVWIPTQLDLSDEARTGTYIVFVLAFAAVLLALVFRAHARVQQDAPELVGDDGPAKKQTFRGVCRKKGTDLDAAALQFGKAFFRFVISTEDDGKAGVMVLKKRAKTQAPHLENEVAIQHGVRRPVSER